jgi:signal transduction histidine kinase
MQSILLDYYFTLLEVLVFLLLAGCVGGAIYWGLMRHWQRKLRTTEQRCDPEHIRALHNHIQSAVAHEFGTGLDRITNQSAQTLEGLSEAQDSLRDKQHTIISEAQKLDQHADNILDVFAPEQEEPQRELLNIRGLVEGVLVKLYLYAESKRVTLRTNLADVEPTLLNRDLTLRSVKNVIHNAIRYSYPGGVVETTLTLKRAKRKNPGKVIWVEVKDTGSGISEEEQGTIFELGVRGDGLIQTGSGLGLYLARQAARRQGGNVILVNSSPNEGSLFRIILPYTAMVDSDA